MNLVKKIKDILFEVEDDDVEVVKINDDIVEEKTVKVIEEQPKEVILPEEKKVEPKSERELFKSENNTFTFPDFDEEEFQSSLSRTRENRESKDNYSSNNYKQNNNVLDFERKKNLEKRNEYTKYDRGERLEKEVEKKKFKPSPIISPVYGILNKDYKSSDIVDKADITNIDVDFVRKKAFEPIKEEKKIEVLKEDTISEPVVTFFEEKDNSIEENNSYKSIDDLLVEASDEITLDDTLEIPIANNLEAIEEELEKIDEEKNKNQDSDITLNETFTNSIDEVLNETIESTTDKDLDNDLFELIDSMYEEREEE